MFDIYHFSNLFETISFGYVFRLQNFEADHVAKSALLLPVTSSLYGVCDILVYE